MDECRCGRMKADGGMKADGETVGDRGGRGNGMSGALRLSGS
nr:hypothetical protein [Blautia coccoides]